MNTYFLLLALLLFSPLSGKITASLQQDKTESLIDQTVNAQYTITYPTSFSPNLFPFFYQLNQQKLGSVRIVSSNVTQREGELTISFTLAPTDLGKCLFAPGFLSFNLSDSILLPGLEFECLSSGLSSLLIAPLLPLHPETKIRLSPENRLRLQSSAVLLEEKTKNVQSFAKYKRAWNTLNALLLSLGGAILLMWALIEYQLWSKIVTTLTPQKDPVGDLLSQLRNPSLPLEKRWPLLSLLIREALSKKEKRDLLYLTNPELSQYINANGQLPAEEKTRLNTILERLELICFANSPSSEEEWQTTFHNSHSIFK